jgi:hypothetical protein
LHGVKVNNNLQIRKRICYIFISDYLIPFQPVLYHLLPNMSYLKIVLVTGLLTNALFAKAGAVALPDSGTTIKIILTGQTGQPKVYTVVSGSGRTVSIIYSVFDIIDGDAMGKDPEFENADKQFKAGNPEPVSKLSTKYYTYKRDTVSVADSNLKSLITKIAATDKDVLEQRKETTATYVRLDGGGTSLQIITDKGTTTVSADASPLVTPHPMVKEFLKLVFDRYRQNTKASLLKQ